jgi:hypothetical protein
MPLVIQAFERHGITAFKTFSFLGDHWCLTDAGMHDLKRALPQLQINLEKVFSPTL